MVVRSLDLRVAEDAPFAVLTPDTGLLEPGVMSMNGFSECAVDIYLTELKLIDGAHDGGIVLAEYVSRQPVARVVSDRDCIVERVHTVKRCHGAERLFGHDVH